MTSPYVAAAVVVLSACSAPADPPLTAPPAGRGLADYLADDTRGATRRPDDTHIADAMRIHVIDVGQGAATLLEFPCGAVLVDTGGEDNEQFHSTAALKRYLADFFRRREDLGGRLDLLVITHPHIDHTRGLSWLLEAYPPRNIIDNGSAGDDEGGLPQVAMHRWLEDHPQVGHRDIRVDEIDPLRGQSGPIIDPIGPCGVSAFDPDLRVLWGQVTTDVDSYDPNPNEHSVVLRAQFGESSALLTGDLQKLGVDRMMRLYGRSPHLMDVDVYQVGHHGARNATSAHQMRAMTPRIAVISMGPYARDLDWTARRYGHPNIDTIGHLVDDYYGVALDRERPLAVKLGVRGAFGERGSEFTDRVIGKAVYATGWDGNVVVNAHASGWLEVSHGD